MKVGLIRHAMDEPQGGARQVALLARDLLELGEQVTLYCYRYDPERCFPDILAGVPVSCVVEARRARRKGLETGWRRTARQLRRYYLETPLVARLIAPDTDVLNPHEWLAHRAAALFARRSPVPVVWAYNDPSGWHLPGDGWLRKWLRYWFGRLDTQLVTKFAAVTTLDRRMKAIAAGAFGVPVHVVRSGVDTRLCDRTRSHADRSDRKDGPFQLLSVGILFPHRRFEDVIRAVHLARLQGVSCRYEIIGSDRFSPDYGAALRALVNDLGLCPLVGFRLESISESELDRAYQRADVLVFPNERQTWGLAVLEAMARNVPVIVSRGAGVHEVLTNGENALLVDPGHPEQIAEAIVRLAKSPELCKRLADAGRRLVVESYTSRRYATEMAALFRSCIVRARAR